MDCEGVGIRVRSGKAVKNCYVRQEMTSAWISVANAEANGSAVEEESAGLCEWMWG